MGTTGTGTVVAVYHWQTEGEHHVPDGKNVSLARATRSAWVNLLHRLHYGHPPLVVVEIQGTLQVRKHRIMTPYSRPSRKKTLLHWQPLTARALALPPLPLPPPVLLLLLLLRVAPNAS